MLGESDRAVTVYRGTEFRWMVGMKVRVLRVLEDNIDPTTSEITDDPTGTVRVERAEVQPWLEEEGRFSFVTSDPLIVDLDCFALQ